MRIFSNLLLGLSNPKKLYLKKDYYRLAKLLNLKSKREEAAKLLIEAGSDASQALLKSFNDTSDNSILHLRTLFGHFQRTFQVSHIDH